MLERMDVQSSILARKAATDAGYDIELPAVGGWLVLGSSGAPLRAWIAAAPAGLLLALSSPGVLLEMQEWRRSDVVLPRGADGALVCVGFEHLRAALSRARILDATLPNRLYERWAQSVAGLRSTEIEALVRQRVGQDLFRAGLLEYSEGRCAVTGIGVPELLRASHIKPWRDATDEERLDVHNGLLLAVHVDAMFDGEFLTFDETGTARWSSRLPMEMRAAFGLTGLDLRIDRLTDGHLRYLAYHRLHVYRGGG